MNIIDIMIFSGLAAVAKLFGTGILLRNEKWAKLNSILLISFAAGAMISISFLSLLPEAAEMNTHALTWALAGFLGFYLVQQAVMVHPCGEQECHVHQLGVLSTVGLTIHAVLDGIAIAAGFEAAFSLGLLLTFAVLLHDVPEGISITGILLHTNTPRPKVIFYSVLVALATPVGAIGSYFFIHNVSTSVLGILLAATGGSFLYLAAADLLPETHRSGNRASAVFFFLGVFMVGTVNCVLH